MDYKLADESIVGDNVLEEMAGEWESGGWDGHLSNVAPAAPQSRGAHESGNIRLSESRGVAIKAVAKKTTSRSQSSIAAP